ncbi:protein ORANGE-LIKE, chloroplastic-like isoform X2 [Andrographis paniculata]|uniref:protein ORANGE-LIKE, chloroplastic-like isoform X2 n=1 Tax=Andrographis paniculata TaxID=175694 RepID=UPI0021E837A0|nr:protein ORANGE-LIKE, chloroplastic-like isoform X2 [Andrographis paniculata]
MNSMNLCSPLYSWSVLAISYRPATKNPERIWSWRNNSKTGRRRTVCLSSSDDVSPNPSGENNYGDFCIIEGPETVHDFEPLQLQEIQDNIRRRRNNIFLLMEEVRRLRVQERIKSVKGGPEPTLEDENDDMLDVPSSIPFLPRMTDGKDVETAPSNELCNDTWNHSFRGPYRANPRVEVRLRRKVLCGFHTTTSFAFAIKVDPIVASFSGGAVGVISAFMLLELRNVRQQEEKKCKYCSGTGYLACARCSGSGLCLPAKPIVASASDRPLSTPTMERCPNCSGAGKVMCPTCLCTGMAMASEHDPRIEPFNY